jgi:hypothetical protein
MTRGRPIAPLLTLLAVAGLACGGEALPAVPLHLALDGNPGRGACAMRQCDAYPLDCGALLGVRVVDASTSDPAAPILEEYCQPVPAADNLCALADLVKLALELPARRVRVEVALWRPDAMGEQRSCPRTSIFDLRGVPRENVLPQPAFGGAEYFDLGSERLRRATVRLACTGPDELGRSHCPAASTPVTVTIDDLENNIAVSRDLARMLDVGVGTPRQQPNPGRDQPSWILDSSIKLTLGQQATEIQFTGALDSADLEPALCARVREEVPQAVAAVTCTTIDPDAADLRLRAHHLPKEVLDRILAAMALGDNFPQTGLVVGRVVDENDAGLSGVTVALSGSGTVEYLDASRTGVNAVHTAEHGYFVSRNAPFNTIWTATDAQGRRQDGTYQTGLVEGTVSTMVIRMTRGR